MNHAADRSATCRRSQAYMTGPAPQPLDAASAGKCAARRISQQLRAALKLPAADVDAQLEAVCRHLNCGG